MARYLFAVDPGLKTGVCLIDCQDWDNPVPMWAAELTIEEFYVKLESVFNVYGDDLILVFEDFHITVQTAKNTPEPWSLHLIGLMMYFCWKYNVKFSVQSPVRKGFASPDKQHRVGFWHVGGKGHANDAYKHAMIYLADNNPQWVRKLLDPDK